MASGPKENHLLASLPRASLRALSAHLRLDPMPLGSVLYEAGEPLRRAYFPTTSIVSLQYVMRDGGSAEVAGVGNEGMVGVSLVLGSDRATSRAMVQTAGDAYSIDAPALLAAFEGTLGLQRLLLRYTQALITQMTQTSACNRHHSVEQQVCRCLLLNLDRMPSRHLVMTQELIATLLGVRRESVTEAAGALKERGIIRYHRGRITVLERRGLQKLVCECYAVVKAEHRRLMRDLKSD